MNKKNDPEYARKWAAENAEHLRVYRAEYYKQNRDRMLARNEARRLAPERVAARKADYARIKDRENERRRKKRAAAPELVRSRERATRAKAPQLKRVRDVAWRAANPDRSRQIIQRSKAAKPDLYRQHAVQSVGRRRARKRAAPTEIFTSAQIHARDRNRCHLCGKACVERRSIDHLVPIARGGAHMRWNVATAHLACNKRRGVRQILFPETRAQAEAYLRNFHSLEQA